MGANRGGARTGAELALFPGTGRGGVGGWMGGWIGRQAHRFRYIHTYIHWIFFSDSAPPKRKGFSSSRKTN